MGMNNALVAYAAQAQPAKPTQGSTASMLTFSVILTMKKVFLYYPSVDLPSKDSLNRMLLYTDGVRTLFPLHELNIEKLNDDYKYLIDEDEFQPIFIYELLEKHPGVAAKIDNEFISISAEIIKNDIKANKKKEQLESGLASFFKVEDSYEPFKVKELFPEIFDFLKKNDFYGYASGQKYELGSDDMADIKNSAAIISLLMDAYNHNISTHSLTALTFWFREKSKILEKNKQENTRIFSELEINVGILYVCLIVNNIKHLFDDYIIPTSDNIEVNQFLSKYILKDKLTINYNFEQVLPNPLPNIELKKIVKFKQKRRFELLNFRETFAKFEKQITDASSLDEIKEISLNYSTVLEKEILGIERTLKESKIKFSSDSLTGVLNLNSPSIQQALITGGLTGTLLNNPLSGLSAGAISFALNNLIKMRDINKEISKSPYSYIFYGKKNRIL